jgi:hypothetical protein
MHGQETKTKHIHTIDPFCTVTGDIQLTGIAFRFVLSAVNIAGYAKSQFQVILRRFVLFIVIYQHCSVIQAPLRRPLVSLDDILYRPGYLAIFFLQQDELILHNGLPVSERQYIRGLMHIFCKNTPETAIKHTSFRMGSGQSGL